MEERTYVTTARVIDQSIIEVASFFPGAYFTFYAPAEALNFLIGDAEPMAFVKEKPCTSNWFDVSLLLLYDKSNPEKFYIPEKYRLQENQILQEFHAKLIN